MVENVCQNKPHVSRVVRKLQILSNFFRKILFSLGLFTFIFPLSLSGQSFSLSEPSVTNLRERDEIPALTRYFSEKAVPFEVRPLLADYGGFGSSLHVRIDRPEDEGGIRGTFALAVPLGSAFAVETALALIEAARGQRPSYTLLVAFLGDEKSKLDSTEFSEPGYSHKGLRDLISLSDIPGDWVVCYLEADGPPETLLIRHGTGNYIAPLELVRPLPALFRARSISASFEVRYNELYKLGLAGSNENLALLWEGELNGICLHPGSSVKGRETIKPAALAELLLDYAGSLDFPLLKPDRHYTQLTLGDETIFVSEKASVLLLVSSAAAFIIAFLIYSVVKRVILLYKIRVFLKYSWIFFIFLPLAILIIRGTGLFYAFLLHLFKIPIPGSDFWGSILIIFSALWLFYTFSLGLDFLRFPRKVSFYGISAIILSAAQTLSGGRDDPSPDISSIVNKTTPSILPTDDSTSLGTAKSAIISGTLANFLISLCKSVKCGLAVALITISIFSKTLYRSS